MSNYEQRYRLLSEPLGRAIRFFIQKETKKRIYGDEPGDYIDKTEWETIAGDKYVIIGRERAINWLKAYVSQEKGKTEEIITEKDLL